MNSASLKKFSEELSALHQSMLRGIFKSQSDDLLRGRITLPQFAILSLLQRMAPLKMTEVACHMNSSLPSVSGIVDRLHSMGYVLRKYDDSDRRIIRIDLTPKGHKIVQKLSKQKEKVIERLFGRLSEKDRQAYLRIIKKVNAAIHKSKPR